MVICNRYLFRSSPMKNPHSFSRFGGPRMGGQSCGVLPMTSSTVMFVGVHPPAPWHETSKTPWPRILPPKKARQEIHHRRKKIAFRKPKFWACDFWRCFCLGGKDIYIYIIHNYSILAQMCCFFMICTPIFSRSFLEFVEQLGEVAWKPPILQDHLEEAGEWRQNDQHVVF